MEDTKTLLFYLLSIAGLIIVSLLFTSQTEQQEVEPPQPVPVTSTVTTEVKSLANQPETEQEPCVSTTQTAFYTPDRTHLEGNRLVISGTVYASDFVSPLPNAPVEVSLVVKESYYPPYNAFHAWFQTDETGYYEATIPKPGHYGIIYLYYRANDQDNCLLTIQLFFIDDAALDDTALVSSSLMKLGLEQAEIAGSVLQGPIDIVLSVPPPKP
jgi:hypothetical protein